MRSAVMIAVLAVFLLGTSRIAAADSGVFIATTDFETGSAAFLEAGSLNPQVDLLTIHGDAFVEYHDGRVYVLNRLGQDNVLVLETGNWRTPALQFSVGNGTNPYDIEFAGAGKAYVSRYASPSLLIVDPRDGSQLGEIDLSGFADGDGIPEMAAMVIVGSRLYVACQRLDRNGSWGPVEVGVLVVVDTETDALVDVDPAMDGVQGIELAGRNPNSLIAVGKRIVVAGSAGFGDRAGGIEIVDTATSASAGLVIGEEALGGDITGLALYAATRGYAVISDENFVNSIRPVDLSSGEVGGPLAGHSGGYTPDLAVDGGRLIVADGGAFSEPGSAGLLVYDAVSGELIAGPLSTGLPPANLAVLGEVVFPTAVLEETAALPQRADLGRAYPNPFNAGTQIPFAVESADTRVSLAVYDALGRKVRTLVDGFRSAGNHSVIWDGLDDAGVVVGNGAYLVELRAGERRTAGKILLLK